MATFQQELSDATAAAIANHNTDALQRELDMVNAAIERNDKEWVRTSGHALNPAGDIGGIRSRSPRQKGRIVARWDRQAAEGVALMRRKKALETRIAAEKREVAREAQRPVLEAEIERVLRDTLKPGDPVHVSGFPNPGTVVRVNAKSVSVKFPSGYKEAVQFSSVAPVDWKERYAAWKQAQESE